MTAVSAGARNAVYSDVIRERWRRPRFRGDLAPPAASAEDVNPLCGDRVRMTFDVDRAGDDTIRAARFTGDSCAICTASADVLSELVQGRTRAQALAVTEADLLTTLAADIRPTRMRCVTLPLTVLGRALGGSPR